MSATESLPASSAEASIEVINSIIAAAPPPGHHLHVARLDRTEDVELRELHDMAGRLARALLDLGVRRGDRVGYLPPTAWSGCSWTWRRCASELWSSGSTPPSSTPIRPWSPGTA